jgi:putative oxidoreductase
MGFWRTILRVLMGCLFIGHGTQKLFGWFGGAGLAETEKGFDKLGLEPRHETTLAAGLAEAGGGAMLVAGAETSVAASMLIATMLTAIRRVHFAKGPWVTNGGYEYNVVLIGALLAVVDGGPGRLSVDVARGRNRKGVGWAAATLAAGALGAVAVDAIAERRLPELNAIVRRPIQEGVHLRARAAA